MKSSFVICFVYIKYDIVTFIWYAKIDIAYPNELESNQIKSKIKKADATTATETETN